MGQHVERVLEIWRVGRCEHHSLAGTGVLEAEANGVQPLPVQPQLLGEHRVGTVGRVAEAVDVAA